jgi:NAD(P)-dependent dehydrogenase (short-subunit alcohol dehydrogenase family)
MSNHTSLKGAVALVSGANRGIGAAFVSGLLEAGANRVYAAARDPQTLAAPTAMPASSRSRSISPTTHPSRQPRRGSSTSIWW